MTKIQKRPLKWVKKSTLVPDEATKIYEDDYNRLVKKQRKIIKKKENSLNALFNECVKTVDDSEKLLKLLYIK